MLITTKKNLKNSKREKKIEKRKRIIRIQFYSSEKEKENKTISSTVRISFLGHKELCSI